MYARFKAFCQAHNISVGTTVGLLGFVAFTASGVVSQVGGYDYSGLPTWAQSAIGAGLAGLVVVGRFATSFSTWVGRFQYTDPVGNATVNVTPDVALGGEPGGGS